MSQPVNEWFYQAIEDLVWDKYIKVMGSRLVITMKNFLQNNCQTQQDHGCVFLQGNLGFKKIVQIIYIHKETRKKTDELFQSLFVKTVGLANKFGIEEYGYNDVDSR